MILFGHIGITTALINSYVNKFGKETVKLDYRAIIIGSVLPDLIDKPLVNVLSKHLVIGGKLAAHTLVFSMLLIVIGAIRLITEKKSSVLILGMCSLIHALLDLMWVFPSTYLYPIYGLWPKLQLNLTGSPYFVKLYFSNISYILLEIVGASITYKYYNKILNKKRIVMFIKSGSLND